MHQGMRALQYFPGEEDKKGHTEKIKRTTELHRVIIYFDSVQLCEPEPAKTFEEFSVSSY